MTVVKLRLVAPALRRLLTTHELEQGETHMNRSYKHIPQACTYQEGLMLLLASTGDEAMNIRTWDFTKYFSRDLTKDIRHPSWYRTKTDHVPVNTSQTVFLKLSNGLTVLNAVDPVTGAEHQMSIDLNWETLTTGPEGLALAETIREFVHDKFQQITLPRFIKSVNVHAFEFGSVAPELEIKDICDPLPDFYEDMKDGLRDEDDEEAEDSDWQTRNDEQSELLRERRRIDRAERINAPTRPSYIDTRLPGMRSFPTTGDAASPFLGASTAGIPGGTSNLHYFHSQLATGLSGTQTPLAAVAGAHLPNGWPDYSRLPPPNTKRHRQTASGSSISRPSTADAPSQALHERASVSTLATSATPTTRPQTRDGFAEEVIKEESASSIHHFREPRVEDLQTVFRVWYSGDIKLSLTAEILLDYPMPSFVGIPLKLNITGLSFDGVAVLAYIRKRAHFCFLSPEDASAAADPDGTDENQPRGMKMGGLLHEIKVESEIGQRENGKQVLKNVGKVEKFVLEQVRRIFEDEFVYPSFWTFLV